MDLPHRAEGFGLDWRSDIALGGFGAAGAVAADAPVEVYRVDRLPRRCGGRSINRGFVYGDGIRLEWGDEVAFDMIDGARIAYAPGPGWTGAMPASFYGTVAALTVAWRGMVPLHACAVELAGRAVLIAGAAGAGKSTLTAGLVALGARFVADDLTVVAVGEAARIGVTRGRPTIRLHADAVSWLDAIDARPCAGDERGKWIATPRRRTDAARLAPGAIVLLDAEVQRDVPGTALVRHLFRRRWLAMLPMRARLIADLLTIGQAVPVLTYSAQPPFDAANWRRHAEQLRDIIRETD